MKNAALRSVARRIVPVQLRRKLGFRSPFARESYAQDGEDLILASLFRSFCTGYHGFYVDVGAHHPLRLSNTQFFYQRGWRGINIDARPGCMKVFQSFRPRDINIEAAISDTEQVLTYCEFNEPALNGFESDVIHQRDGVHGCKIVRKIELKTRSLTNVLQESLPAGQQIDFLSVDVEGHDLAVLKSMDWERFLPYVVLVEDDESLESSEGEKSPIRALLEQHGYRQYYQMPLTTFYIHTSRIVKTEMGMRLIGHVF